MRGSAAFGLSATGSLENAALPPIEPPETAANGAGRFLKRRDVLRRVLVSLSVTDQDDSIYSTAQAAQSVVLRLDAADQADTVQATAVTYWREAQMVIDKARLVKSPAVALIRSKYEAAVL